MCLLWLNVWPDLSNQFIKRLQRVQRAVTNQSKRAASLTNHERGDPSLGLSARFPAHQWRLLHIFCSSPNWFILLYAYVIVNRHFFLNFSLPCVRAYLFSLSCVRDMLTRLNLLYMLCLARRGYFKLVLPSP